MDTGPTVIKLERDGNQFKDDRKIRILSKARALEAVETLELLNFEQRLSSDLFLP